MTTTINVPETLGADTWFADFLDGKTAIPRRAAIHIQMQNPLPALILGVPDHDPITWPIDALRLIPDQAAPNELVLALDRDPMSRLIVQDPGLIHVLRDRARNLSKRPAGRGKARLLAWAAAAVASVVLIVFVLVPVMADQLAEYLSPAGEQALGDATFEQIRAALDETGMGLLPLCANTTGLDALDAMTNRLTDQLDLPYPVKVHVLDRDLINAFALPGGHIAFFRGLIDAAEGPDEVAAVFAHEIGHVVNRDPTRSALRSAGSIGVLGLLFGDFAGGAVVLFLTERLIEATYSRGAEAGADAFAHGLLADSGIPPSAIATMFERLRAEHGEDDSFIRHFAAHPSLGNRIVAARAADAALTGAPRPSLGDADWQALRRICN